MARDEIDQKHHISVMNPSSTHQSSHHASPTSNINPRMKNEKVSWLRHRLTSFFILLIVFSSCISSSTASKNLYIKEQMIEARTELLGSTFARLARSGTILVDQRPPPAAGVDWTLGSANNNNDDLKKRAISSSSTTSTSASTKNSTSSATLAPTTTTGIAAATETGGPLPTSFDVGFNNNITASCQDFMTSMLSNSTFKNCLPFSLLLQNSNSFFQASKSLVRITQTLDYTCAADVNTCSLALSHFASNLTTTSACASDLSSQNPIITQAHLGLQAYRTLYTASCLRDPDTSSYCFGEAITNATNPTDSYIYFLPLNVSLVGGSQPTCDKCLQLTMAAFEQSTNDRKSAISSTYASAAGMVNVNCGPGFVNASLAAAVSSAAPAALMPLAFNSGLLALGLLVGSWLL